MPTPPFIIIDGYNLLHTIGSRRSLGARGNLQRARMELAGHIAARMNPSQCERTTIVFDALAHSNDLPDSSTHQGISVLFSKGFPDADSMIEFLLQKHSSPKKVIVVSNDRRVQTAATRRRAAFVDCESWYESLAKVPTTDPTDSGDSAEIDRKEIASPDERQAWLREFGYDP